MATTKTTSNVQSGYGGVSQWDAIKQYALASPVSGSSGYKPLSDEELATPSPEIAKQFEGLKTSIDNLSAANASLLKGEIPADVAANVRRAAAESSIAGGIFGSSSRNLSARDLGLTSMQIRAQGVDTEEKINTMRSNLSAAIETIRKNNIDRNTQLAQLDLQAREQNLKAIDVERQRIQTNISANVNILQAMAGLAEAQQRIAVTASASDVDPSNVISSIDNWLAQLNGKLS